MVSSSMSLDSITKKLGKHESYARYVLFDIRRWKIDISHFRGRQHLSFSQNPLCYTKVPLDLVFSNTIPLRSWHLKARLIEEGLKEKKCEHCQRTHYSGEEIPLELNHKNGDHFDNSKENIEIICPNCHSLTPTFAGRNRKCNIKYSSADVVRAVLESTNVTQALKKLGYSDFDGDAAQKIQNLIGQLNLSTIHWRRGKGLSDNWAKKSIHDVLIYGSRTKPAQLRDRLINEGIKEKKCEVCGICDWDGRPLTFTLDHINGDRNDSRLDNVRILCYVCHARTPTYKGKNKKNRA